MTHSMKSDLIAIVALIVTIALFFGQGCVTRNDCNGMWTYNAKDWNSEEIQRMNDAVSKINDWAGSEIVFIHAALPHEVDQDRCVINRVTQLTHDDTKADGLCQPLSGNLSIDMQGIKNNYENPLDRLEITFAHELLHGMGFAHVTDRGNVMHPKGMNGDLVFGEQDSSQCVELGYCQ